jgi:hypothetical protein
MIAPLLKNNDIIMAHDYSPDIEYFEKYMKNKIWDWMEINDNDIEQSVSGCGLQTFHQDLLLNIAWLSKKKIVV